MLLVMSDLIGMFKYTQTTLYFSLFRSHDYSLLKVGYFRLDRPGGNDISTLSLFASGPLRWRIELFPVTWKAIASTP